LKAVEEARLQAEAEEKARAEEAARIQAEAEEAARVEEAARIQAEAEERARAKRKQRLRRPEQKSSAERKRLHKPDVKPKPSGGENRKPKQLVSRPWRLKVSKISADGRNSLVSCNSYKRDISTLSDKESTEIGAVRQERGQTWCVWLMWCRCKAEKLLMWTLKAVKVVMQR